MAKKIYLSAAAHAVDNPTKCPVKCGENIHCNQYMDIVERRLRDHGIETKRGDIHQTGDTAMRNRVREANGWGADIYYVAHTNAGGGRYSMTMCWKDAASIAKAKVIHKHRRCVATHKVVVRTDLYEIRQTAMPCLYDELFFHDNGEDCRWFHNGGMIKLAEETVQALCELVGVTYRVPTAEKTEQPQPGDVVKLYKEKLYLASTGTAGVTRTGTFYLYDGVCINGRYRVTNRIDRVGKKPLLLHVSGWVML